MVNEGNIRTIVGLEEELRNKGVNTNIKRDFGCNYPKYTVDVILEQPIRFIRVAEFGLGETHDIQTSGRGLGELTIEQRDIVLKHLVSYISLPRGERGDGEREYKLWTNLPISDEESGVSVKPYEGNNVSNRKYIIVKTGSSKDTLNYSEIEELPIDLQRIIKYTEEVEIEPINHEVPLVFK